MKPVADSPSAPAIALKTAMIIAIHFLIPLGSTFCVLMMLNVYDAKIRIFSDFGIFFHSTYSGAGPARWGGGRGWVGRAGRRAAAAGRRRRGTAARGHRGHGRRAEGCAGEEGGRAHGAPRETAQRAAAPPPPPACVDGCGRRARGWVRACFTWNTLATGSFSVRYGLTLSPRLLQTYRNYPSNTLLGSWLRGYRCKHMVTDVNNGRLQM